MTAPLAGALVLSGLTAVTVAWLFIALPRRITAEEWIVHRRSFQRAHDTTTQTLGLSIGRTARVPGIRLLPDADLALLGLASFGAPATGTDALRRLALLGGGSAAGVIIVTSIGGIAIGATWLAVASPLLALLAALVALTGQWVRWRLEVSSVRTAIRKDLPRLLTGARVLLDSGTANAEQALAAAVGTYADPAAELLREALRLKEVRRVEFEAAVDEVADRYAVGEFHRLPARPPPGHRAGPALPLLPGAFS